MTTATTANQQDVRTSVVQLAQLINSLGCLEVRRAIPAPSGGFISFECRAVNDDLWLPVLAEFLREIRGRGVRHHVCDNYFLDDNGRMDHHWYMRFTAENLLKGCSVVGNGLLKARARAQAPQGPVQVRHPVPVESHRPDEDEMRRRFAIPDPEVQRRNQMEDARQGNRDFGVREVYSGMTEDGKPVKVTEVPLPWLTNPEQKDPDKAGARGISPGPSR